MLGYKMVRPLVIILHFFTDTSKMKTSFASKVCFVLAAVFFLGLASVAEAQVIRRMI
jgi:hypothetical protein